MNCFKLPFVTLVLCSAVAIAQTGTPPAASNPSQSGSASTQGKTTPSAAPSAPSAPQAEPPGSLVPETEPVITINGVCEVSPNGNAKAAAHAATPKAGTAAHSATNSPSTSSDCKTQITRAEFEKLMKTVAPGAPPQARRQIASRYVQFLTAANEGVKLGVDKDPEFNEQLSLMRLQLLGQNAEKKLQAQASNVSDADLKSYYDQNPTAFEEVTLTRLYVPRVTPNPKDASPAPDAKSAAPDPKAIADNARQQLMIGGDPDKIEKGVYDQLKNTTPPPSAKFGARRRGSMPAAQEQKIFAMKDGEVSEVIPDPSGFVVYRVDEKKQLAFEDVKEDVKQRIMRQRISDVKEKVTSASKTDYNDAYFGPETQTPRANPLGGSPPASRPPSAGIGSGSAPPPASSTPSPASTPPNPK